jgi:hypothetical protein
MANTTGKRCEYCGIPLVVELRRPGPPQRFCDPQCAREYASAERRQSIAFARRHGMRVEVPANSREAAE